MTGHERHDPAPDTGVEESLRALLGAPALAASTRARHLGRLRGQAASLGAARRVRARRGWLRVRRGRWLPIPSPGLRWLSVPAPRVRARLASGAAAGALAAVLGTATVVAAAGGALPGQLAYPAKILGEQAALTVRGGGTATTYLLLLAERRLGEAEALVSAGGSGELVGSALAEHERRLGEARARAAGDPLERTRVDGATREAAERLGVLAAGELPPEADERARAALQRIAGWLDERADDPGPPPWAGQGRQDESPPGGAGGPGERPGEAGTRPDVQQTPHVPGPAAPDARGAAEPHPGDGRRAPQAPPQQDGERSGPAAGGGPPTEAPGAAGRDHQDRPRGGQGDGAGAGGSDHPGGPPGATPGRR